jgi:transglutaminase-like putative cysteine protease
MKSSYGLRVPNLFFFLFLFLAIGCRCFANPSIGGDNNIIITSSVETFRFEFSKTNKRVEVKQETINKYSCLKYRDKAGFFKFFDSESSLDDVQLYENGKKGFVSKTLTNYSVEDIFYSDAQVFSTTLNFPKSGWENEIRLKKTIFDPRYFCTVYFDELYPIAQKEINIIIPRWMKVDLKEFNFEGYHVRKSKTYSEKDDADIITYALQDIPERKSDNNLPGPSWFLPHILLLTKSANVNGEQFTYFNTLTDQYNWYRNIIKLVKNDPAVMKEKALEITKGVNGDMNKVKAILYWVHDNIRYVAFEDGLAGFKPDESQNVLNKKYGDCKGMANLTKELLKSLGFDTRLAWIGTNHIAYDYSTPALCVDNHMICCLIYNGKKYFLDGTESYLAFENYAERIQGRQVLVENGDNYLLERIPVTSADQNLRAFTENLSLVNNTLSGNVQYLFKGESKEQFLSMLNQSKKENISSFLNRYITNENSKYLLKNVTTSDLSQTDGDLSIKFMVDYSDAVSSFGKDVYIDLDYNKYLNKSLIDTARQVDYRFPFKYNFLTEVTLTIPSDFNISSLPEGFEYRDPGFSISVAYSKQGNIIKYIKRIVVQNSLLKKSSFPAWNAAIAKLSSSYLDQIILTKK